MASSSSRVRGPQTGISIPHKVLLHVIDYDKKTNTFYRVMTYKLLEGLMRMASTSNKINVADTNMEKKLRDEMDAFWEAGMRQTEDTHKPDIIYTLELGLAKPPNV